MHKCVRSGHRPFGSVNRMLDSLTIDGCYSIFLRGSVTRDLLDRIKRNRGANLEDSDSQVEENWMGQRFEANW